jgi:hypothetical protein
MHVGTRSDGAQSYKALADAYRWDDAHIMVRCN